MEGRLAPGEREAYLMPMKAGEYARVSVEQTGNGVTVSVSDPAGRDVLETETVMYLPVSLLSQTSGEKRIELRPAEPARVPVEYRLSVEELRPATGAERDRVAADRVFADAERLRAQGTAESLRAAAARFQEALGLYQSGGDATGASRSLTGLGRTSDSLSDRKKALDFFEQAIRLQPAGTSRVTRAYLLNFTAVVQDALGREQRALELLDQAFPLARGDPRVEGITLNNLGLVNFNHGRPRSAEEFYQRALPLHRAAGNLRAEANTENNLGTLYESTGEPDKSLEAHQEALNLRRILGDAHDIAISLNNIGAAYFSQDDYQKALDFYQQALPLWRTSGDRSGEAATLHNIGNVFDRTGEHQKALDAYSQALPLHRAAGYRAGEANTLNNLGLVYQTLGDTKRALDAFDRALTLHRAAGNPRFEAATLTNIGAILAARGDFARALETYQQALSIQQSVGNRVGEALALNRIAELLLRTDSGRAMATYEEALSLERAAGSRRGEALTLLGMGEVKAATGEGALGMELFRQALPLFRETGEPHGEALARYQIARVARDQQDWATARAEIDTALELVESLRQRVPAQDLRSAYLATVQSYYELAIEIAMQAGDPGAALSTAERARARSLLDLLGEAGADIREGVDLALLERERFLQRLLNAKAQHGTPAEVNKLSAEYRDVQAQIRASSPRYAALTQPNPLNLREIQEQVLDRDTVLLEYALGQARSYLFLVSHAGIAGYMLPGREEIAAAARRYYQAARSEDKKEGATRAAARLVQMVLAPVAGKLKAKRLLIVADAELQYVPFAALPLNGRPLIAQHEVVSLPSASTLAVLRREVAGRTPAPRSVAVLADPVFRSDDPRVAPAVAVSRGGTVPVALPRLIGSRREAAMILALAPPGETMGALDFDASAATVASGRLRGYRIVHFATHALIDTARPELSSLVLTLVDPHGVGQDGYLRLNEIYNLKLPAELVVLSACQTALGSEIRGEGLVSLARGFMYAGAPRIVASLWKVDDKATTEIMRLFYRGMLGPEHLRPAAALRAAQVEISHQNQWQDPYYWAAWQLQGEWR